MAGTKHSQLHTLVDRPRTLTPRATAALERMAIEGLNIPQAAEAIGCSHMLIRRALATPQGRQFYERQLMVMRSGERAKSFHTGVAIRDDPLERGKTRLLACKYLDGEPARNGTIINLGVGITVKPGYIVDVSAHADRAKQLLQVSGDGPIVETYQGDSNSRADAEPSEQAYTQPDDASENE